VNAHSALLVVKVVLVVVDDSDDVDTEIDKDVAVMVSVYVVVEVSVSVVVLFVVVKVSVVVDVGEVPVIDDIVYVVVGAAPYTVIAHHGVVHKLDWREELPIHRYCVPASRNVPTDSCSVFSSASPTAMMLWLAYGMGGAFQAT
jgi:hypothetical protein